MKNQIVSLLLGFLAIFGVGGYLYTQHPTLPTPSPVSQAVSAAPTPTSNPVLGQNTVAVSAPQTLIIPKLGVSAPVEAVGQDAQGRMDIPKKNSEVAWYDLGPKPGEKGNSVMAGHLDTVTGAPAVFYYLSTLKAGDKIEVVDQSGHQFNYQVTSKAVYPLSQFPLQEVFGSTDKTRLNLITCQGIFNQASKLYDHRVVVYSELI